MIMKAQEAYRKAKEVRAAREAKNLADAINFLQEYEFNKRVMEACEKEQFMLPDFINIDDSQIANAVFKILKEFGYNTSMSLTGAKYQIAVRWSNPNKNTEENTLSYLS